jgi:hypothetical protein
LVKLDLLAVHDGVLFGQFAHFHAYHSIVVPFFGKLEGDFHGFSSFLSGSAKTA